MKNILYSILLFSSFVIYGQKNNDSTFVFKKRVLENTEIDLLTSFYTQDGDNAAVTGGIGSEELKNIANNISISIPLNDDDILAIDATISAYSSASSSNLNPFSGASTGEGEDEDENDDKSKRNNEVKRISGSPWYASSGASGKDVWLNGNFTYSHTSDDRNSIYDTHISIANEFDYTSFGAGLGYTRQFNQKNTELGLGLNIYLDTWHPEYPTEIKTYIKEKGDLNADFFKEVAILNHFGDITDKNSDHTWKPLKNILITNNKRNTYAVSLSFSQIINKRSQISIFSDITYQMGWLSNPMQRVYFSDIDNYYIGNPTSIEMYTNYENVDVFQLADDIERLPDNRLKIPIATRFHYYINEFFILKTYYRYYFDDWGIKSNTLNIEIPIKLGDRFTLYPSYRLYNQSAADYFAGYEQHLSSDAYYTSDFDLSEFKSDKYSIGIKYTDIFTKMHLWKINLKNISLNYSYYNRNTGLKAHIVSFGTKYIFE
jgi:hypothetical protein